MINLTTSTEEEETEETDEDNSKLHAFLPLWCSIRTENYILHLFEFNIYSLSSVTRYSPAFIGDNLTKLLFIAYQIVSIFKTFQDLNLYVGEVHLKDFSIMKTLHVKLKPKLSEILVTSGHSDSIETKDKDKPEEETEKPICDIVEGWTQGRISNLDYILYLNREALYLLNEPNC